MNFVRSATGRYDHFRIFLFIYPFVIFREEDKLRGNHAAQLRDPHGTSVIMAGKDQVCAGCGISVKITRRVCQDDIITGRIHFTKVFFHLLGSVDRLFVLVRQFRKILQIQVQSVQADILIQIRFFIFQIADLILL